MESMAHNGAGTEADASPSPPSPPPPQAFRHFAPSGPSKPCHITNNKFQILGSITIPKTKRQQPPPPPAQARPHQHHPHRPVGPNSWSPQRLVRYGPKEIPNAIHAHRAMPVKIVQQQAFKARPAPKNLSYGRTAQAIGPPVAHNVHNAHPKSVVAAQKLHFKNAPQKMVVHQPPTPIATSASKDLGNGYRFVHGYGPPDVGQPSSNQDLTAQILQSLSQPKHFQTVAKRPQPTCRQTEESHPAKKNDQRRLIHGDADASPSPGDAPGSDGLSHHYQSLQSIMLDHTYALSAQNVSNAPANGGLPSPAPIGPPAAPASPVKTAPTAAGSPDGHRTAASAPPPPIISVTVTGIGGPPPSVFQYCPPADDDDAASIISSIEGDKDADRADDRRDSDTETAPEGEEEGKTRCVCEFTHDDGYMICCDRCGEWQHVDCMGIDRQNIPDDYMCDRCQPRAIDRKRARSIQIRKREEITGLGSSGSDSSSGLSLSNHRTKQQHSVGPSARKRPLTITTYSNTISGVSRTVPQLPNVSPPFTTSVPSATIPNASRLQSKKVIKRPRRLDNGRKGPKRKFPEKRKRKASEISSYRSKYSSFSSSNQLSQWSESYEAAMTNHYSPELRAKIARYCNNKGVNNVANTVDVLTVHLCTTVPHAGSKILIATKDMKENTPIIELRGKYMLSAQHKPQPQLSGRVGSQRPGPFLFFYRLPKDSTQICIDTRTYGNEARFVRRSCKPNAELQHCIIKGVLHVYLVTIAAVQSNTEISIRHDSTGSSQPCACGNPNHCKQIVSSGVANNKINSSSESDRRGRTRLSSSSSMNNLSPNAIVKVEDAIKADHFESDKDYPIESDLAAIKQEVENNLLCLNEKMPEVKVEEGCNNEVIEPKCEDKNVELNVVKEELKKIDEPVEEKPIVAVDESISKVVASPVKEEDADIKSSPTKNSLAKSKEEKPKKSISTRRTSLQSTRTTRASIHAAASESADEKSDTQSDGKTQSTKEKKKMTREERKMEAIMKAFERLEKAELRKQENRDRQSKRRESDSQHCSNNESKDANDDNDDFNDSSSASRRRRKKCRPRTVSQNQQRNRNRLNSADSDMVTSGEESLSLLSPPINTNSSGMSSLLINNPSLSEDGSGFNDSMSDSLQLRQSVQRLNVGLSSACLLVEAAVGPLESTFKFPKTKKDIMNEWLNKSPERNSTYEMNHSMDYSSTSDNNNSTFVQKKAYIGEKFENLMKAADTMIGNFSGSGRGEISSSLLTDTNSLIKSASVGDLYPQIRKDEYENNKDGPYCSDKKMPRRYRKGMKNPIEEFGNVKRCLRSNTENLQDSSIFTNFISPHLGGSKNVRDSEAVVVPQPLQHSAKKRWLRQAISEESDSPTAESPPNEMLTPLKKRRLARESLSVEPPNNWDEPPLGKAQTLKKPDGILQSSEEPICDVKPTLLKTIDSEILIRPEIVENCTNENLLVSKMETSDENATQIEHISICENYKKDDCTSDAKSDCQSSKVLENIIVDIKNVEKEDKSDLGCVDNTPENIGDINWKNNLSLEEIIGVDKIETNPSIIVDNLKIEPPVIHSAETSGNSSPVLDDIDDIKKKIHSFHTENIQILQIRNKKQPTEKRKKVNLNFDLCVLADQTVGVKLRSEQENVVSEDVNNDKAYHRPTASVPFEREAVEETQKPLETAFCEEVSNTPIKLNSISPQKNDLSEIDNKGFTSSSFANSSFSEDPANIQMPDINVIKNAIDMTASLEIGIKSNTILNSNDEYKNVQEILSRVNQMDSHNSLLLSGVLKDSSHTVDTSPVMTPNKTFSSKANDPRLNPPPVEKPKPIRRKLSITEYRRRHSMVSSSSGESSLLGDNPNSTIVENALSDDTALPHDISRKNEDILESLGNAVVVDKNECLDTTADSEPGHRGTPSNTHCETELKQTESQLPLHGVNVIHGTSSPPHAKTER